MLYNWLPVPVDRKPVLMFWPNDSILNRLVLKELVNEEKGIQDFEM